MQEYDHKKIEKKWQKKWAEEGLHKTSEDTTKEKSYVLDMFPYPSGEGLHVGHPKGYIATDVYSRFKRMQGLNILHPMGWDAFGLPAENYAIKNKVHPRDAVEKNIAHFKEQLQKIGFNYDWEREINTTDPEYYKWTQWIFLQLFKKGLAYESHEPINWCPQCYTGLANEDLEGNECERCGTTVEKRPMRQWVLKITDYADRLLNDLEKLPKWPEHIKELQRNWIGRSEGAEIEFEIKESNSIIKVFTTRPDTLFGATYMVLSPEHEEVQNLKDEILNWDEVEKYIQEAGKSSEIERTAEGKEKTGVKLEGITAINPANKEEIPVFIADYVLAHYGTGAIMAVPAHDERDMEFAKKYDIPVQHVVIPAVVDPVNSPRDDKPTQTRHNVHAIVYDPKRDAYLALDSKEHEWKTVVIGGIEEGESAVDAAKREVREETGYTNIKFKCFLGGPVQASYFAKHKDENRSSITQGLYFELENDEHIEPEDNVGEVIWVKPDDFYQGYMINSELPHWLERIAKNGDCAYAGEGILINSGTFDGLESNEAKKKITEFVGGTPKITYKLRDWVFSRQRYWGEPIPIIHCEKCGAVPVPEKDLPVTLPEVKKYEPTGTGESPLAGIDEWVNTQCPKCGGAGKRETNTMPQWAGSSWYYLRFMDPHNDDALVDPEKEKYWAPVDLYVGGAEHATRHLIYARFWHKFLFDIKVVSTEEPFTRLQSVGLIAAEDGRKMSKRYGNVINPDDIIERVGADTLRIYEMFMGPFEQSISWSTDNMVGSRRFLEKVWGMRERVKDESLSKDTNAVMHKTIQKVGDDIEGLRFNTAISQMMIFANQLDKNDSVPQDAYKTLVLLLAPFAPHATEEIWSEQGSAQSIFTEEWPVYDERLLESQNITVAVQVNGKLKGTLEINPDTAQKEIEEQAFKIGAVQKALTGTEVQKIIYVPGKILSIVTT